MSEAATKPPRRVWRWVALAVVVLLVLPVAGVAIYLATLDLNQYKPQIEAAAQQATGRRLELRGPVHLGLSLVPTLEVADVHFANAPGGSRPQMASIERVEVQAALLPLLSKRLELRRLVLVKPDILLETDAQGRGNWELQPAAPAAPPGAPQPQAGGGGGGQGGSLALGRISITEGRVTYRDGRTGRSHVLGIRTLALRSDDAASPLHIEGEFALDDKPFTLAGEVGPLAQLTAPPGPRPWPVKLALEAEGARFGIEGGMANPAQGKGWRFQVTARVPELARFARWVPDAPLPALRDIQLALGAADAGAPLPELTDLRLSIGESDLAALAPGLRLARLTVTLPRPDQPVALALEAALGATPMKLEGSLGAPALLLPPGSPGARQGPYPVDLALNAGPASASIKGAVAQPAALSGVALAVALRVPELAALAPLAGGAALPPIRDLALGFDLAERSAGFASGAHLRNLRLTSSAADATGELTLVIGQRTGISGRLASNRVNLDALKPPARPGAAPAAPAPAPAAPARGDGRLIPDTPLPLDALKLLEAELRWTIGELLASGTTLREVVLALNARDGLARLEELSLTAPGGRVQLRGQADVRQEPPQVAFALRGDQLDAPALLNALGVPNQVESGRMDLDIDVRGRGRSPRQIAATLGGHAGLAVTGLQSRGAQPDTMLGRALQGLQQAVPAGGALVGRSLGVACAAFRFDASDGIARSRAFLVDSTLGRVGGGGEVRLTNETLALRLNTDLNLGIIRIRAPVPVGGTFAAPQFDYGAVAAGGVAGTVAGTAGGLLGGAAGLGGSNNPLGGLLGSAGSAITGTANAEIPDCASQLAIARGGRQGPVPAAVAAPAQPQQPAQRAPAPTQPSGPTIPGVGRVPGLGGLFGR